MFILLRVNYPLFLSDFNDNLIFSLTFVQYSYIKFHENPSIGSRFVAYGLTDGRTDGQIDATKTLFARVLPMQCRKYSHSVVTETKPVRDVAQRRHRGHALNPALERSEAALLMLDKGNNPPVGENCD
jgi:hypothetical protein